MEALETLPSAPPKQDRVSSHTSVANQFAEAMVIAVLIAIPALVCLYGKHISDPDVFWHMRTGEWILTHHAVPRTDTFTSFGAGKPWQAYSWLFDLSLFKSFQGFGLAGILGYSTAMVLAISAAIYHLVRRLQPDFSIAVLLTFIAVLSLIRLYTPRTWLFTILFFTIQLNILLQVRKTGKMRDLLWLPLIYLLWTNIHIQFVDGLLVLALAFGETLLPHWLPSARTRLSAVWMTCIFIACVLATLVNPYGWHIYKIAHDLATQSGAANSIAEMRALEFRNLTDYGMLFLALAAACALAGPAAKSSLRRFAPLETLLLALAAILSFRSGRDMWIMIIVAVAILAQAIAASQTEHRALPLFALPFVGITAGLVLFIGSRVLHVDNATLRAKLIDDMPVHAVAAIKQQGYSGPLYNTHDWGGYLIWDLRMPVSIDNRAGFAGDDLLNRSFATWNGSPNWATDPDLSSAGLVIGPITAPLTQLLRTDPRFQLAYQDKLAAVFTARRLHESAATKLLNADR